MLGFKKESDVKARTWVRGVSQLCTLGGMMVVLSFALGAQCITTRCTTDAECAGTDFCDGVEACVNGRCANGAAPCATGETCNEDEDRCDACTADGGCDDANFCNGEETCVEGQCVAGTNPCADDGLFCNGAESCDVATDACTTPGDPCDPATETCDEDSGSCVTLCDDAGDCNDDSECTDDSCVNGGCQNTDVDCDDDDACTTDTCDAATGCASTAVVCPDGQSCDAATGDCVDAPACETDADCEDGVFCNGAETCDFDTGNCVSGDRPCDDANGTGCTDDAATESCSEGDNSAVCSPCPSDTLNFTLGQNTLIGTTGNDTFSGPLEFNAASGTQVATLQTGDSANGLAGADVLGASFNTAGTVVPTTIAGIETFNLTNFAAGTFTLSAGNISGVDRINSVSSVDDITISNLQELVDFGMSTINSTAVDFSLQFGLPATTSGSADTITGTFSAANIGTVTIQTAAGTTNGFETLALVSEGSGANTVTNVTQTNGTTLRTLTLAGAQAITLNTIPNTILTYNAATATGAVQLGTGTTAGAYTTFATANLTQITGGTGNDLVIFNNTLDTNDFTTATLDLGAGTDVVQSSFATDLLTSSPFRNTEEVRFNATAATSVNFNGHTGLATITVEEDGTATAFTLQNVPATAGVFPTLAFRGDNNTAQNQTYDTITYTGIGNTGSSDSLSISVGNRGTALNSGTATTFGHVVGGGTTTAAGFETFSVTCTDGPCTFAGISDTTLVTLNVTGSSNVTLGTVDATASTVLTVNAANVVGSFSATVDDIATGSNITLGSGNDTFTTGAGSTGTSSFVSLGGGNDTFTGDTNTASADTITGGDGSDTISGGQGVDTITSGSGADIVIYDQVAAVGAKNVTDFTSGSGGDIARFDISSLALANAAAEVSGVIAGLTNGTDVFLLTGSGFATDALAETAITADDDAAGTLVFIYFNTTDSSTHIIYDTTAETDATPVALIGRLTNITTQAAHDALTTAANFDSQP